MIYDGSELIDEILGPMPEDIFEEIFVSPSPPLPEPPSPDAFLEFLSPYHLNQHSSQQLLALYELLRHRKAGRLPQPVHYGLLVECGNDQYAIRFLSSLSEFLEKAGLLDREPDLLAEEADDDSTKGGSALRIIHDCRPLPMRDNLASVSSQDRTNQTIQKWEAFWQMEEWILEQNPSLIGTAVVSSAAVRGGWKQHEHLYYRVYNHHIRLDDLPAKDILKDTYDRLAAMDLGDPSRTMDEDFIKGLSDYVEVVYPKADLRNAAFVDDLVNRVLTCYYSAHDLEGFLTARCVPYYRQPQGFEQIISRLDGLAGMEAVKEQLQDIYYQTPTQGTPLRLSMAFVGNPGTGKTTVARMMADLLYAMGLTRTNKLVSARPSDLISPWVGQTAIQTREICQRARGGVLFIDEAYTLTYTDDLRNGSNNANRQCVDTLLQEMEDNAAELVVIFAGYPEPIRRFLDSNRGLRSRVSRIINFPDFDEAALEKIFDGICAREKFTLAEDAREDLRSRIGYEKSGEGFGNARTMETVFHSIRAEWQRHPNPERVFTREHVQATLPERRSSGIKEMTGLEDIKKQLERFERRVKYLARSRKQGVQAPPVNLHMLFTGNPGTGKTSVARVIAEDLYKAGVLKTNKCICIEARDLVSDWSAAGKKMEETVQRAMGGVLFLDEAYALTEYASGAVGREAVAALITAMEKYRGELLVILAGYPENMRAFLGVNPGLSSRIGFTFEFPDYSVEELTEMFLKKMRTYNYILAEGAAEKVSALMEYFHVLPGFGNGRFVDNVIDETITLRSMRDDGEDPCRVNEITENDIPEVMNMLKHLPDGGRLWDPSRISQATRRRTAVHEVGHALVLALLDPEVVMPSISITDQALSYGRVRYRRSGGTVTEDDLMNDLAVYLAGRDAERLIYGNHDTGCGSDFQRAKELAKAMLERYAMGPELGATDITPLLRQADETAARLLAENKQAVLDLSEELLKKRKLSEKALRDYLASHPAEK